jgi:asparagine synthase (glutamine-hydrolysing)
MFASEIKALLKDPELPRQVNEEAFFHYLSFLTAPAPQTLFAGVQKLPAGHLLRVRHDGTVEEKCWWDVWDHTRPQPGLSEKAWAEKILEEIETSVRYRQVSDVPVGVCLSGGIDSSTNAALFARHSREKIKTFTIGYVGNHQSYKNETAYARLMAESIGAEHHELLLTQDDLLNFLPEMIRLQDEPIADPVCVPLYYVSKLARANGVIVCQVGEGADELFCGYPAWGNALLLSRLNRLPVPASFKRLCRTVAECTGKTNSSKYAYLRRAIAGLPLFWSGAEAFYDHQKPEILHPRLREKFAGRSSWEALEAHWRRFRKTAWETSDLHWMSYTDLKLRLPELLLMRVDKMSMGVSLESRVPFLDHKLVELALSIPAELKYKNTVLKNLLKKAVAGVIPARLIHRPKQGFGTPVYEWGLDRLGACMRNELERFCAEADFLHWDGVSGLFARKDSVRLWYLYNFALWWKEHFAAGHTS